MLSLALATVFTVGQTQDFPGYITLPARNVSAAARYGSLDSAAALGLAPTSMLNNAKMVCDSWSGCSAFDGVNFYLFANTAAAASVTSYVSNKRCAAGSTGKNVTGGCVPGAGTAHTYWNCPGQGAGYTLLATFALPPFLIAQSCDGNSACVAFTVGAGGTSGSLWAAGPALDPTTYPTFVGMTVKDPAAVLPSQKNVASARQLSWEEMDFPDSGSGAIPTPAGYTAFPSVGPTIATTIAVGGWPMDVVTRSVPAPFASLGLGPAWFGGGGTKGSGDECFTAGEVAVLLAAAAAPVASGVYTFIDRPTAPPVHTPLAGDTATTLTWNAYALTADATSSFFVRTAAGAACQVVTGDCSAGQMVKCAGHDTSAALVALKTYDVPAEIIAQICDYQAASKGCMAFAMNADNTQGTTYTWPASVNITGYIKA